MTRPKAAVDAWNRGQASASCADTARNAVVVLVGVRPQRQGRLAAQRRDAAGVARHELETVRRQLQIVDDFAASGPAEWASTGARNPGAISLVLAPPPTVSWRSRTSGLNPALANRPRRSGR